MKRFLMCISDIMVALIISTSLFAQGTDRLSGKNQKIHYSVKTNVPFDVVIKSETSSKGEINYIFKNLDYSNYFQLEKGGTANYRINPTENVREMIIKLFEGAILIDHGGKLVKATEMPQTASQTNQPEPLPTGSFIADTIWNIDGEIIKGKIYLKDYMYRYDMTDDGKRKIKIESVGAHGITQQIIELKNLTIIVNWLH